MGYNLMAGISGDWIRCPVCGQKCARVLPSTRLVDFPLFCKKCKNVTVIDFADKNSKCACADAPAPIVKS